MATPMTPHQDIQEKILTLSNQIEKDNPGIKTYLAQIHKALKEQEGIVQLLTEEELAILVAGYSKVAQLTLTEIAKSSKKSGTAALKGLGVDDL